MQLYLVRTPLWIVALAVITLPWWPSAASAPAAMGAVCDPSLLELSAQVDAGALASHGAAELWVEIAGTEQPVAVRLTNHTPGVVFLEGGDEQVVTSTGGRDNHVALQLFAHRAGDFQIDYELPAGACAGAS